MQDDLRDLAPLYALGLTESAENEALLAHAAEGTDLLRDLDAFQETAAQMSGLSAAEPPASVKARLLQRIAPPTDQQRQLPDGVLALVRGNEGPWRDTPFPGIAVRPLFKDPLSGNQFLLVRMAPGSVYPSHHHEGIEHSYILEGDAIFDDHTLYAGDYEAAQSGHDHSCIRTKGGCLVFLIRNQADRVYAAG
jgi:anti-sigma factor ChrR (cupin superfamily)